jgi:hypothetical protein
MFSNMDPCEVATHPAGIVKARRRNTESGKRLVSHRGHGGTERHRLFSRILHKDKTACDLLEAVCKGYGHEGQGCGAGARDVRPAERMDGPHPCSRLPCRPARESIPFQDGKLRIPATISIQRRYSGSECVQESPALAPICHFEGGATPHRRLARNPARRLRNLLSAAGAPSHRSGTGPVRPCRSREFSTGCRVCPPANPTGDSSALQPLV